MSAFANQSDCGSYGRRAIGETDWTGPGEMVRKGSEWEMAQTYEVGWFAIEAEGCSVWCPKADPNDGAELAGIGRQA